VLVQLQPKRCTVGSKVITLHIMKA